MLKFSQTAAKKKSASGADRRYIEPVRRIGGRGGRFLDSASASASANAGDRQVLKSQVRVASSRQWQAPSWPLIRRLPQPGTPELLKPARLDLVHLTMKQSRDWLRRLPTVSDPSEMATPDGPNLPSVAVISTWP